MPIERVETWENLSVFAEQAQDGPNISKADLKAIRNFTRGEIEESKLYVFPALAIDTRPTRNCAIYSAESQKATVKAWIGKPFLFNANGNSDIFGGADHRLAAANQVGRIYKSQLVETGKGNVGTLVWVFTVPSASAQVQEFVNKISAGILREVSIHVLAANVVCSICDEPLSSDQEHWPGTVYGKQTCYAKTVGELEPLELSSVACPGSTIAHVMDDEDVSKYKLVSLREALGSSRETFEEIMSKKTETDLVEAKKSGSEDDDMACKTEEEEAKKPDEGSSSEDSDEASEKNAKSKDKGASGSTAVESLKLFEGAVCVACGHDNSQKESVVTEDLKNQILATYKEDVEARVKAITESANKAIDAAKAEISSLREATSDAAVYVQAFLQETVGLAIEKGLKTETERESYTEELAALGFKGMRTIREAISLLPSSREAQLKDLKETAQARLAEAKDQTFSQRRAKTVDHTSRPMFAASVSPTK